MTAITFPNSPSSGDTHTAGNGIVYTYDGEKWTSIGTNSAGTWTRSGTTVSLTNAGDDLNVDSGTFFVDASADSVGIGTTDPSAYNANGDNLAIQNSGGTGSAGITIRSGTGAQGTVYFADGTSTDAAIRGYIQYSHNGDFLRLGTLSNERLRIDSSGRMLVGTSSTRSDFFSSSPDLLIEKNSGSNRSRLLVQTNLATNQASELILGKSRGTTAGSATVVQDDDELGIIHFAGTDGTNFAIGASIKGFVDNTPGNDDMPGRLVFSTTADGASTPTERMRIDSSGDVEIMQGKNLTWVYAGGSTHRARIRAESSDDLIFENGSGNSERMRLDSSGRLLVGTSTVRTDFFNQTWTPKFQFEGTSDQNSSLSLTCNAANTQRPVLIFAKTRGTTVGSDGLVANGDGLGLIAFMGSDGSENVPGAYIGADLDGTPGVNDMPTRLRFSVTADGASSPTEHMRIVSGGFAKFKSGASSYFNSVGGMHEFVTDSNNWTLLCENEGNSIPYGILVTYTSTTPNNTGSQFFIGTDSTGDRIQLRSNGGIANYQSNDANLCDEREKKNIETLDSTWDCLKNWELKKFHYNEDADTTDKRYGVIAQQVEEHCPEVLTEWVKQRAEEAVLDDDGNVVKPAKEEILRKGVKEQQMMWMAIKALQEAQTRIETLEAKVAALEAS